MKTRLYKSASVLLFAAFLAGCQDTQSETEEDVNGTEAETTQEEEAHEEHDHDHNHDHESDEHTDEAQIEGLSDHYHTGDTVSLTATSDVNDTDGHWHWYQREDEDSEWEAFEDEFEDTLETEAVDGMQIKAAFYDDDHNVVSESQAATISIDDHDSEVYEGYFDDEDVKDRDISDWAGNWQSVYPYFEDGELDEVYEHRAEENDDMSFEEQKEYYEAGYQTEVDNIDITEEGEITFHEGDESYTGTYVYDGYEILEYEAGNRGVRFIFQLEDGDAEAPQYIQFSDHIIAPEESGHFHLYWGDDNEALLEEMEHWPTYYPEDSSVDEIIDDLLLH